MSIKLDYLKNFLVNEDLIVGFINAKYADGKSVANVAFQNEYGTMKIPPRPFFRNAISENMKNWLDFLQTNIKKNPKNALGVVGEKIRGDVIESIQKTNTPPNAEFTIKVKKSSKPLVDSGLMLKSVTYKVIKK